MCDSCAPGIALWKSVAPYSPCLTTSDARAHLHHGASGKNKVVVACEHARFCVVDEEDVEPLQDFKERGLVVLDPVIHGVAGYKFGLRRGFTNSPLKNRIDVG